MECVWLSVSRARRPFLVVIVALSLVTCVDDPVEYVPEGEVPAELGDLPPGIHPVLSIPPRGGGGSATTSIRMHLVAVGLDAPIASYQGELHFSPETFELRSGTFPDGTLGAWNLIRPGVVRFAGVRISGVGNEPALELEVLPLRPISTGDFRVVMEEVVAGESFADLTSGVSPQERPLLTTERFGSADN